MKKALSLIICLIILALPLFTFTSCQGANEDSVTLYVYNWGEYMADGSEESLDVNEAFEEWYFETYGTRVEVNYSTYSSNEDLYAKITSGAVSYDVIVPSDYMVQRLAEEEHLRELNKENIPNLVNILPEFLGDNTYYDIGNKYSVPYLYGMIGIIYNTDMVDEEDIAEQSWSLLWNKKYSGNILQFNNSRDAFGTAMYKLGYDVNTDDERQWREALELLKEQKKIVQGYVMDEVFNKMENGSAAIAAYYAGDYLTMLDSNEALGFYYPKEGTNFYVDAMCVPTSSKNPEIAERYIDFMLTKEAAVANAEYTYYASPNRLVVEDSTYQDNLADAYDILYPTESVPKSPYENLSDEKLVLLNSLWEELKSDIDIGVWIYIICGVIIAALMAMFIAYLIKKRVMKKIYENP